MSRLNRDDCAHEGDPDTEPFCAGCGTPWAALDARRLPPPVRPHREPDE